MRRVPHEPSEPKTPYCFKCGRRGVVFVDDPKMPGVVHRCSRCGAPVMSATPRAFARFKRARVAGLALFAVLPTTLSATLALFSFLGFASSYGFIALSFLSPHTLCAGSCVCACARIGDDIALGLGVGLLFGWFAQISCVLSFRALEHLVVLMRIEHDRGVKLPVHESRLGRGEKSFDLLPWRFARRSVVGAARGALSSSAHTCAGDVSLASAAAGGLSASEGLAHGG